MLAPTAARDTLARSSGVSGVANSLAQVSSRRERGVQGRFWAVPTPYRGRTGNTQIRCYANDLQPAANRFPWSPKAARPFLKSAQCRFESDWGHLPAECRQPFVDTRKGQGGGAAPRRFLSSLIASGYWLARK